MPTAADIKYLETMLAKLWAEARKRPAEMAVPVIYLEAAIASLKLLRIAA